MKNIKQALYSIYEKKYEITDKDRIKQKEQLELKNLLTESLLKDFEEEDIEVIRVPKGFVIVIPNEEDGAIPVEVNIVTKPLDYDYDALNEEYISKLK